MRFSTDAGNGVSINGLTSLTLFGGKITAGTGNLYVDSANVGATGITVGAGSQLFAKIGSVTLSADNVNVPATACTETTCPVIIDRSQFVPQYSQAKATDETTSATYCHC